MPLTREQLIQNIEAMEKQGANQSEIQSYLDSQKQFAVTTPIPTGKKPSLLEKGLGIGADILTKGVGGALIKAAIQPKRIKETAEVTGVSPLGRAALRPAVSLVRGIQGKVEPVETPFGAVKPISEMTPKESLLEAVEVGTAGIGVGAAGRISSKIASVASKISKNKALKSISVKLDELSKSKFVELLQKRTVKPATELKKAEVIPTEKELEIASKYENLLQSKNPLENWNKLANKVDELDKEVEVFLTKNNSIFNEGQLRNYLLDAIKEIDDINVDPKRLLIEKEKLVDGFLRQIETKNLKSLWQQRKKFDYNAQLRKAFSGTPNLKKDLQRGIRNATQEFISTETERQGLGTVYKTTMKEMSDIMNLIDEDGIVTLKVAIEKGGPGINIWLKKHPNIKNLLYGAGTIGLGYLGFKYYGRGGGGSTSGG